jgi:hypothetical protein
MTEDDLPPPPQNSGHSTLAPPTVTFPQADSNWPIKNLGESFFDRALANGSTEGFTGQEPTNGTANGSGSGGDQLDAWANEDVEAGEDGEDEGWDLDAEVNDVPEEEEVADEDAVEADLSEGVSPGVAEDEMWIKNSPLAADHAAAGAYESAMQVSLVSLHSSLCNEGNGQRIELTTSCSIVKWPQSISNPSNPFSYNAINPPTSLYLPTHRFHLLSTISAGTPRRPR